MFLKINFYSYTKNPFIWQKRNSRYSYNTSNFLLPLQSRTKNIPYFVAPLSIIYRPTPQRWNALSSITLLSLWSYLFSNRLTALILAGHMFFLLLRFSMMQTVVCRPRILLSMVICGSLMYATAADSHTVSICPVESVTDWIFGFRDQNCVVSGANESPCFAGVTEVRRQFYLFLTLKRKKYLPWNWKLYVDIPVLLFFFFFRKKKCEFYWNLILWMQLNELEL